MKTERSIMDILEAFDLYGSYRAAAKHVRCSPNTVKKFVLARQAGDPLPKRVVRAKLTDAYRDKIDELVSRSDGAIMAKKVHEVLSVMGFAGWRENYISGGEGSQKRVCCNPPAGA